MPQMKLAIVLSKWASMVCPPSVCNCTFLDVILNMMLRAILNHFCSFVIVKLSMLSIRRILVSMMLSLDSQVYPADALTLFAAVDAYEIPKPHVGISVLLKGETAAPIPARRV